MTSYEQFKRDIREAIKLYTDWKINLIEGKEILAGIFNVVDDEGVKWNSFSIEIHHSEGYPYCFPLLFETGHKIPKILDWHINEIGSCCITVPITEAIACRKGLSVIGFIEKHAKSYLFNQAYRLKKGVYAKEEYLHGIYGLWEYYEELFQEKEKSKIIGYLSSLSKSEFGKKTLCFCGRKAKFRKCHTTVFNIFKHLSKSFLQNQIKLLSNSLKILQTKSSPTE